ncbi:hypothetical protein DI53_0059 [Sphingobacterium deserti]|uniref:Core-binding (CB) domain-containing protein n=2 Tax=Sphingobacterium deserti TaxID=1229276 RepID=A0A0B8T467_9SPHI|nr:hypothetical protein DI53_0059 [Sphingobacterium deserti]
MGFDPFRQFKYSEHSQIGKYNVCRCIDEYLDFARTPLKPNTYKVYEDRLHLFKRNLLDEGIDHKRLDQVSKDNIFDFVTSYKANRGWENKTYNHYLQPL